MGTKPPNPTSAAAETPSKFTTKGVTIHWQEPTRSGATRRVMEVRAENGDLDAEAQSGVLRETSGILYHDDRPRARFTAPVVEAAKDSKRVVARGGVVIHSVEPPGVTVTADRITWYADRNKIIAEGQPVYIEYRPPGAAKPLSWGRDHRVTVDTQLENFSIP